MNTQQVLRSLHSKRDQWKLEKLRSMLSSSPFFSPAEDSGAQDSDGMHAHLNIKETLAVFTWKTAKCVKYDSSI